MKTARRNRHVDPRSVTSPAPRRLRSASEQKASKNLEAFIAAAKTENVFGINHWADAGWPVRKASRASRRGNDKLRFWQHQHAVSGKIPFAEPFASFVKALVCERQSKTVGGLSSANHEETIRACRYVYEILAERSPTSESGTIDMVDPTIITPGDLINAEAAARTREREGAALNVATALQALSDLIDRRGLTRSPLQWRRQKITQTKYDRVGDAAALRRQAKMPNDELLEAVAEISRDLSLHDRDILRQRAVDLLVCGGFRINELLTLPRNTWVEEQVFDINGERALDRRGKAVDRYGLRYWPEKGGAVITGVKWLVPTMVDVARRAVDDILRITQPHADVARFIHDNPGRTRLGTKWDAMSPDALLTKPEVAELLNFAGASSMHYFSRSSGIQAYPLPLPKKIGTFTKRQGFLKKDVETFLVGQCKTARRILPRGEAVIELHECLFVVPVEFFHPKNGDLPGTAVIVNDGQLGAYLCGNSATKSIFERRGMVSGDGTLFRINSHQFRHWLDTLFKEGGLNEAQRARWFGRKDVGHNAAYDHTTPALMAARVQAALRNGNACGPVANKVRSIQNPIRREEFIKSVAPAAHVTDLGGCLHDWSATPCHKHGACGSGCDDLWLTKGNPAQRASAAQLNDQTRLLVSRAQQEQEEGSYGADNWLAHHESVVTYTGAMLRVHDDPSLPDGTMVRLPRQGPARIVSPAEAV